MGRLRNQLQKTGQWTRKKATAITAPVLVRDVAAGIGILTMATGIGMIYFPAALIAAGALLTLLAVASEPRRRG